MAVPSTMSDLSTTASSNSPAGSENPISTDDFHRAIQAILRHTNAKGSDIASASSINLGTATGEFVDVTGTTTITALGTISAGIVRTVRFTGALTLTHNATSLILPTSANITTANGDVAMFRSLGSGNWVCVYYMKKDGTAVSAPYLPLAGGTVTGDVVMSGATLQLSKGADVASATALPLITDGNYFDVTGTTAITSFNSVGVGTWVRLHFDGALTLTHNATDLILPGGANITTEAGDEAEFIEYASGDWRCVSYTKSNGTSIVGGITIGTATATTSGTTVDFTSLSTSAKRHTFILDGVSISGIDEILVQLGDSGGFETTGYAGSSSWIRNTTPVTGNSTSGMLIEQGTSGAAAVLVGKVVIEEVDPSNNRWLMTFIGSESNAANTVFSTSIKSLSAELDRVRFLTTGSNTFDLGSIIPIAE